MYMHYLHYWTDCRSDQNFLPLRSSESLWITGLYIYKGSCFSYFSLINRYPYHKFWLILFMCDNNCLLLISDELALFRDFITNKTILKLQTLHIFILNNGKRKIDQLVVQRFWENPLNSIVIFSTAFNETIYSNIFLVLNMRIPHGLVSLY